MINTLGTIVKNVHIAKILILLWFYTPSITQKVTIQIKIDIAIADAHPILPPSDHIAGFMFHHAKANSKNVTIHAITAVIQIFFIITVPF